MAARESGLGGAESSTSTPVATPMATPVSTRSVKWEKDVEAAAGTLDRPLLSKRCANTTSQMAVVGANTCPIESLDYEVVENEVYNQDWRSRGKLQIFQYQVLKWVLALFVGLVVALAGFFSNISKL